MLIGRRGRDPGAGLRFLIAVERFAQCVLLVVFAVVGLLTSSEGVHEER